jgi:hypothetical protein
MKTFLLAAMLTAVGTLGAAAQTAEETAGTIIAALEWGPTISHKTGPFTFSLKRQPNRPLLYSGAMTVEERGKVNEVTAALSVEKLDEGCVFATRVYVGTSNMTLSEVRHVYDFSRVTGMNIRSVDPNNPRTSRHAFGGLEATCSTVTWGARVACNARTEFVGDTERVNKALDYLRSNFCKAVEPVAPASALPFNRRERTAALAADASAGEAAPE